MSDHNTSGRVTRGALKRAEKRKVEQERTEREKKRFNVGKTIGKNDIVVNQNLGKIKIEDDLNEVKVEVDTETVTLSLADSQETEVEQKVVVVEHVENIPIIKNEPNEVSVEPDSFSVHPIKEEIDAANSSNGVQDVQNTRESIQDIKVEERSTAEKVFEILSTEERIKLKAMLRCRLVCKEWRKSVDWCHGEDALSYGLEDHYRFYDQKSLDKFLNASQYFGSSPILGKTAKFELTHINMWAKRDSTVKTFWESVNILLSKYGENLKFLKIRQERLGVTPLTWYQHLEMILPHLPNLETLEICAEYEDEQTDGCTEQENELMRYMAENKLSLLPKLHTLEFRCETASIQIAIIKNTPKLKILSTDVLSEKCSVWLGKLELKELTLFRGPICLKSLCHLHEGLEYLSLDFKDDQIINKVPFQNLLHAFQRFKKFEQLSMHKSIYFDKNQHSDKEILKIDSLQQLYLHRLNNEKRDFPQMIDGIFKPDGFYANIASYFPNITYLYMTEKSIDNMTCTTEKQSAKLAYSSGIWKKLKLLEDVTLIAKYVRGSNPKQYVMTPGIHCAHRCTWTKKGYEDFHKIGKRFKKMK